MGSTDEGAELASFCRWSIVECDDDVTDVVIDGRSQWLISWSDSVKPVITGLLLESRSDRVTALLGKGSGVYDVPLLRTEWLVSTEGAVTVAVVTCVVGVAIEVVLVGVLSSEEVKGMEPIAVMVSCQTANPWFTNSRLIKVWVWGK